MKKDLKEDISFINICHGEYSLFGYKSPNSYKSYTLDLKIIRQNKVDGIFFHIHRGNLKIAYFRKSNLIYSVGTEVLEIQFQMLEALIEHIIKVFNETFDINAILSYGDVFSSIFDPFKAKVNEILNQFFFLEIVKKVDVFCRVCQTTLPIYVRKSLIEGAESYPVPLVYTHSGHSIVCYIDKSFNVRGTELVHITG